MFQSRYPLVNSQYEVLEIRIVDSNGNPIRYLSKVPGKQELNWKDTDINAYRLQSNRFKGDVYTEARKILNRTIRADGHDGIDLYCNGYEYPKDYIVIYSLPRKQIMYQTQMELPYV